jgi:heptosyltransferase III
MPQINLLGIRFLLGRKIPRSFLLFLAIRDRCLIPFWGRTRSAFPDNLQKHRIVVSKIDHLGDLLMISPFLVELKRQIKSVRVILLTGSWNDDIAQMLRQAGMCDVVCHYDAPSLNRGTASWFRRVIRFLNTFIRARFALLRERPDIFVDLRPFSPNTLFLGRLCKIPFRVGFGLRGLSFTLHREIPYDENISRGQLYLDALPLIGLERAQYDKPFVAMDNSQKPKVLPGGIDTPYILFQPISGEPVREIPIRIWKEILDVLNGRIRVVAIGDDTGRMVEFGYGRSPESFTSVAGETTLREAFEYARQSRGCIGVDSLFAHVGLAFDQPVYVLGVAGISQKSSYPANNKNLRFLDVDVPGFSPEKVAFDFLKHVRDYRS